MASAMGPRGDGKGVEIAVQTFQVAAVGIPAQHGVADEFPRAGEFFPASFPSRIADREIEKFQGAREGPRAPVARSRPAPVLAGLRARATSLPTLASCSTSVNVRQRPAAKRACW